MSPSDDYMVGLEIIVDNVERGGYEAFILANLLKYISVSGINIGGSRSRGYGLLHIDHGEAIALKLNTEPRTDEDILSNIRALNPEDGYYDKYSLDEFIEYLYG